MRLKRHNYDKVVIDACLSRNNTQKILKVAQLDHNDLLYLNEIYPKATDQEILRFVLAKDRLLITKNCVLHNQVLKVGDSYYFDDKNHTLTNKKVSMVKATRGSKFLNTYTVKKLYKQPPATNSNWYNTRYPDIKPKVAPFSHTDNRQQKIKARARRNKIRQLFSGYQNIAECQVIISIYQDIVGGSIHLLEQKKGDRIYCSEFFVQHQGKEMKQRAIYYVLTYLLRIGLQNTKIVIFCPDPPDTNQRYYQFIATDFTDLSFSTKQGNKSQATWIKMQTKKVKQQNFDLTDIDLIRTYQKFLCSRRTYQEYLARIAEGETSAVGQ